MTDLIQIPKNHPDFLNIYRIIKSVKKEKTETRDHMLYLYYKEKILYNTNGPCLAFAKMDIEMTSGFLDVISINKKNIVLQKIDTEANFPKVSDLLEEMEEIEDIASTPHSLSEVIFTIMRKGTLFNVEIAVQFLKMLDVVEIEYMVVKNKDKDSTILFQINSGISFILMPLRT